MNKILENVLCKFMQCAEYLQDFTCVYFAENFVQNPIENYAKVNGIACSDWKSEDPGLNLNIFPPSWK